MTLFERTARDMFITTINNILGKKKSVNYKDHVANMLKAFQKLDCNMSIMVQVLFSHLDRFPDNLGDVSDEECERFHQDIKVMEERYQGRWDVNMMAYYCCSVKRDRPDAKHEEVKKQKFSSLVSCREFFYQPFVLK